jgi:hypothetical protein
MSEESKKSGTRPRIGKRPPRYAFILNPFTQTRVSRCPLCDKLNFPRKFPLLIAVEGWGPYVQGKTCKYCSKCELIICHQDELEEELFQAFTHLRPALIGADYFVIRTVETRTMKAALRGESPGLDDALEHAADFKKHLDLEFDPGGWRPADAPPRLLEPRPPDTSWRRGGTGGPRDGS